MAGQEDSQSKGTPQERMASWLPNRDELVTDEGIARLQAAVDSRKVELTEWAEKHPVEAQYRNAEEIVDYYDETGPEGTIPRLQEKFSQAKADLAKLQDQVDEQILNQGRGISFELETAQRQCNAARTALSEKNSLTLAKDQNILELITPQTDYDMLVDIVSNALTPEDEEVLGGKKEAARKVAESITYLGVFAPYPADFDEKAFLIVSVPDLPEDEGKRLFQIDKRIGAINEEPGKVGRVSISPEFVAIVQKQFLEED